MAAAAEEETPPALSQDYGEYAAAVEEGQVSPSTAAEAMKIKAPLLVGQQQEVSPFTAGLLDAADAALKAKHQLDMLWLTICPNGMSHLAPLRPWSEFFAVHIPDDVTELQVHLEENLAHFQANYVVIAVTVCVISIIVHPAWLWAVSCIAFAWAAFVSHGGLDPNWKPKLGQLELMSSHRLLLLYAGSLTLLFVVFGEALLVLVGALAMLTMFHAAFHPGLAKAGGVSLPRVSETSSSMA
eukprot:TRINITY_DN42334_c0_g1_i1.p1 TRINITY_DN42334_c0_g1~~TRINITY_DN42334_c0_g1_i1.p1  ORF type:complete len:241 (+),score=66.36 TRINITY_DN42334_c0_g1_i1:105-827(+)